VPTALSRSRPRPPRAYLQRLVLSFLFERMLVPTTHLRHGAGKSLIASEPSAADRSSSSIHNKRIEEIWSRGSPHFKQMAEEHFRNRQVRIYTTSIFTRSLKFLTGQLSSRDTKPTRSTLIRFSHLEEVSLQYYFHDNGLKRHCRPPGCCVAYRCCRSTKSSFLIA
jgi:hypothetical protein